MNEKRRNEIKQVYEAYTDCPAIQEPDRCRRLVKCIPVLLSEIERLEKIETKLLNKIDDSDWEYAKEVEKLQSQLARYQAVVGCVCKKIYMDDHGDLQLSDQDTLKALVKVKEE